MEVTRSLLRSLLPLRTEKQRASGGKFEGYPKKINSFGSEIWSCSSLQRNPAGCLLEQRSQSCSWGLWVAIIVMGSAMAAESSFYNEKQ